MYADLIFHSKILSIIEQKYLKQTVHINPLQKIEISGEFFVKNKIESCIPKY